MADKIRFSGSSIRLTGVFSVAFRTSIPMTHVFQRQSPHVKAEVERISRETNEMQS